MANYDYDPYLARQELADETRLEARAPVSSSRQFKDWRVLKPHEIMRKGDVGLMSYQRSIEEGRLVNMGIGSLVSDYQHPHSIANWVIYRRTDSSKSYVPHATAAPLPLP